MIKTEALRRRERRQALLTVVFTIISVIYLMPVLLVLDQLPEGQRLCQHRDLQAAHGGILCGAEELCQGHDLRQLRLL